MELLDKKLADKLKLFEDIDKKYGNSSNKKNYSNKDTSFNFNCNDILKKEVSIKKERYDNIYSDFKSNSYASNFYSPSKNNISNDNPKYFKKSIKNSYNKNKTTNISRNNSRDYYYRSSSKSFTKIKSNEKKHKNLSNLIPPNDSGNRLYNYGYYIKNKLNKKRQLEEDRIKKQMTPKILNRSKELIHERDPNKFEDRLYYAEKNNVNDIIYNRKRTLSKDNILNDNLNFTYHPEINKKSMLIAEKLEPSTLRLNRKKNPCEKKVNEISPLDYYNNLFKNKTGANFHKIGKNNKKNISPSVGNNKANELYLKGIQDIRRKEQTYNENLLKKDEEYKNYSFKPKIIKNYSTSGLITKNGREKKAKGISGNEIYKKNWEWKLKLENENKTKKNRYEELKKKECTFKPEINEANLQNDVKFIMKNIQQMNDYVNKRRKILQQQKEEEKYKKNKFGQNAMNYNIKATIPKEFQLITEKRNNENKKERDLNIYNKRQKDLDKLNKEVKRDSEMKKEKNFVYYNGDFLYCNNIENNNYSNIGDKNIISITQSQQEFINAVNDLHTKIDNLNI